MEYLQIVKGTYVSQGIQNKQTRQKMFENLLIHKRLPEVGYSNQFIKYFVEELSIMDSNNFFSNVGVGEREGRVYSSLVMERHFGMSHGIGRSGDLIETQPKAAGSSILYKLATYLTGHALAIAGLNNSKNCLILPLATGMTLTMCMLAMKTQNRSGKYVIWSRIDQKSCFKSIVTAGLIPLVVDCLISLDGELITDIFKIEQLIKQYNHEILCVLTTTSCFAPRQPDLVDRVATICATHETPHLINNAYGLQCERIVKLINRAMIKGRVDAGMNYQPPHESFEHFCCSGTKH